MRTLTSTAAVYLLVAILSRVAGANEGRAQFETQCTGCHQLGDNAYGPNLCGLSGRQAGTKSGYVYSAAMKDSTIIWNSESLDKFLLSPETMVPGTRMGIIGFEDLRQRQAIASYILTAETTRACMEAHKKTMTTSDRKLKPVN